MPINITYQVQFKLYDKSMKELTHDTTMVIMNHDIKTNNDLDELRQKVKLTQLDYFDGTDINSDDLSIGIIDYKVVQVI